MTADLFFSPSFRCFLVVAVVHVVKKFFVVVSSGNRNGHSHLPTCLRSEPIFGECGRSLESNRRRPAAPAPCLHAPQPAIALV